MSKKDFFAWLTDNPSPAASSKRDPSFQPATVVETPVPETKKSKPRLTPAGKRSLICETHAPEAFLSAFYGRDPILMKEDKHKVAETLTYLSVFSGTGSLGGATVILAKRLQKGDFT